MSVEKCEICGETKPNSLETHHVVPRRMGGSDEPENLVRLCASCHAAVEKIWDDSFYERLGVDDRPELDTEQKYDGIELATHQSVDRQLPENSEHVRYSPYNPVADELVSVWMIENSAVSANTLDGLDSNEIYELDESDPVKYWFHYDRDPQVMHCGYCNQAFLPWEHAKAALHLRVRHRISDPYEEGTYHGAI